MGRYVVLTETAQGWQHIDTVNDVSTDLAAIKAATQGLAPRDREGTFVAVPARSWRPRTRKVEAVQRDRWS